MNEPGESEVGKTDWALFVCTDTTLSTSKILEAYAPRVGHRGVLQGGEAALGIPRRADEDVASHTASIHLCAIRYLMLVHAKLDGEGAAVSGIRADIRDPLNLMSFAVRLCKSSSPLSRGRSMSLETSWAARPNV